MDVAGVPKLPENKQYHVLFLYRSASPDEEIISNLIERLEERKYKCCFHRRDFIPGKVITKNFENLLNLSVKRVFLISEASKKSPWCEFEVDWVLQKGASRLIPLKFQGIEVPEKLQHVTYLEISECLDDDWFDRLISAINTEFNEIADGDGSHSWSKIKKKVKFVAVPCIFYNIGRCKDNKCRYPHVCKKYVVNDACSGNCKLSHDVYNDQSKEILGELGFDIDIGLLNTYRIACKEKLSTFHEKQVLGPCLYYNTPEVGCADDMDCKFTHICLKWFQGNCKASKGKCKFSHDISNSQTKGMMEFYQIDTNQPKEDILLEYREKYPWKQFIYSERRRPYRVLYGVGISIAIVSFVYAFVRRFRN